MNGFIWGIGGFSLGNIFSHTSEIDVCETEHSTIYKIINDWIARQSHNE
jgi:hypothetical protein